MDGYEGGAILDEIAVLIPCYNEAMTIDKVVRDFQKYLPGATIYVYDNNSTDGTDKIAALAGAIVRHETRQGKGNVIRSMFRDIDAKCYLMVDGDDTYPVEKAIELVTPILEGEADMVIGDRLSVNYFEANKRPFHNAGNMIVRRFINLFWCEGKERIKDVMTGYRAFSPLFVKSFPVLSKGFEIETEMTIHALDQNLPLVNVPISYRDRPEGSESKLHTYRDGVKVLKTIFMLYKDYRPLHFFTAATILLAIVSLVLFIPVFHEYLRTGLVPKMPTLITSGFFMLAAILSEGIGLVLDTMVKNHRKSREIQMNIVRLLLKRERF